MTPAGPEAILDRLRAALDGRYRIGDAPLVGEGGMALVYRAHDLRHDRAVALKVLRPDISMELGGERFLQEIRVAAQLQHPLILPLFDSGEAPATSGGPPYLYYVMPLVEGETLRARIQRERQLPLDDALAIVRDVAEALDHAHAHGIVHRDVKPENIFLTAGHAVVADFGIARAVTAAGGPRITSKGVAIGTPEYMSPEQASGEDQLDGRSDLYSLGCVLYEMLAGQPPFTGRTAQAIVARHLGERPPSLRVVRPTAPVTVERAIETALGKVPADRFATARGFVEALGRVTTTAPARSRRWVAMLVVGALAGVGGYAVVTSGAPRGLQPLDWVLVGDFAGPAGAEELTETVRDLVTVELNRSRHFRTMSDAMIREALAAAVLPETTTVGPEIAKELATRHSVRAVVTGRLTETAPGRYVAVLEAIDAASGAPIHASSGPIVADSLTFGVGAVAQQMRTGLGERRELVATDRPLYRVTTPSYPAFVKYRNALDLAVAGNLAASNALLHEALAIDTGFAGAWAAMGMNFASGRNLDSARLAYGEALRRPDRLTNAQVYRLEADAAYALRHDLPATIQGYELFLQEVPTSIGGRNNLALYLSSIGRYEDALAQVDSAIALNLFGAEQVGIELLNRTALLISLGRTDDARATSRRLTGPFARYAAYQLANALGDWQVIDSLGRLPPSVGGISLLTFMAPTSEAGARAAQGDAAAADRILAEAAATSTGSGSRWYQRARLLLALAEGARITWTLPAGPEAPELVLSGLAAVLAGDTARAATMLDRLEPLDEATRGAIGSGPDVLRALLEVARGEPRAAARRIAPLAAAGEHDALSLDRVDSYWLRLVAARAFEAAGVMDSARHYLQMALRPERLPPSHHALRGLVHRGATRRLQELPGAQPGR